MTSAADGATNAYTPVVPGETTPAVSRFDFRHLARLHNLKLLKRLPFEVGPFPSFSFGPSVDEDLYNWNVMEMGGNQLTPWAEEIIRGVDDWDTAIWGIVILHDYRINIDLDFPEEFIQFGVDKAVRTTPRAQFMITTRAGLITTIVTSAGFMDISADLIEGNPDEQTGKILRGILDPRRVWGPYPLPESVTVPLDEVTAAASPRIDPDGPDRAAIDVMRESGMTWDVIDNRREAESRDAQKKLAEVAATTEDTLITAGVSTYGAAVLTDLLKVHESATAQIKASVRTPTDVVTCDGASSITFLDAGDDRKGAVVAYPGFEYSDRIWVTYVPGTDAAYVQAVKGVLDLAHAKAERL